MRPASAATIMRAFARPASTTAGSCRVTLIAAWFNYINRVADALGVGRP